MLLPLDNDNNPVPAVRLRDGKAHSITSSGSSARNATAFDDDTRVISIYATEDVYIAFGDSTVTADSGDHFFPKETYYDLAIGGSKVSHYTHMAVLQVSTGGTVYISEKE